MTSAKPFAGDELVRLRQRVAEPGPWFHNFEIARGVWTNTDGGGPGADYPAGLWQHVEPLCVGLAAKFDVISTYDLARLDARSDTVLFMGVFYHLHHPLVAFEAIRSICTGILIFQTITTANNSENQELDTQTTGNVQFHSPTMLDERFPTLRFVEGELEKDSNCWFVPNVQAVAAMLRGRGFALQKFLYPNSKEVVVRCTVA